MAYYLPMRTVFHSRQGVVLSLTTFHSSVPSFPQYSELLLYLDIHIDMRYHLSLYEMSSGTRLAGDTIATDYEWTKIIFVYGVCRDLNIDDRQTAQTKF